MTRFGFHHGGGKSVFSMPDSHVEVLSVRQTWDSPTSQRWWNGKDSSVSGHFDQSDYVTLAPAFLQ